MAQSPGATYAEKIDKVEARLDWRRDAGELARLVRALSPAPGAWFEHAGQRIKVLAAEIGGDALDDRFVSLEGRKANEAALDAIVAHATQWSPVANTMINPVALTVTRG